MITQTQTRIVRRSPSTGRGILGRPTARVRPTVLPSHGHRVVTGPGSPRVPPPHRRLGKWATSGWFALVLIVTGCSASVNGDRDGTETPYPIRTIAVAPASPTSRPIQINAVSRDRAGEARLSTAVAAAPADPAPLRQRSEVRVALGDLDGAIGDLDAAFALVAPTPPDLVGRGRLLLRRGVWDRAMADFDAAIRTDPGNGDAYVGRAVVRTARARGDVAAYRAAMDDLTLARATGPLPAGIPATRARVLLDRFDFRGDPADLRAVIDAFAAELPADIPSVAALAEAFARSADAVAARTLLSTAPVPATAGERALLSLASAWVSRTEGDGEGAARDLTDALASDPWSWEARRLQVSVTLDTGALAIALGQAEAALATLPDDPVLTFLLGDALAGLGRPDEARAAYDRAEAALPSSPVYRAQIIEAREVLPPNSSSSPGGTPVTAYAQTTDTRGNRRALWRGTRTTRRRGRLTGPPRPVTRRSQIKRGCPATTAE